MPVTRNQIIASAFNKAAVLPYELCLEDFKLALQDVYDFFFDVNSHSVGNPLRFTEIYLGKVAVADFRKNPRGELGTRTATLHAKGIAKLRRNWIYRT